MTRILLKIPRRAKTARIIPREEYLKMKARQEELAASRIQEESREKDIVEIIPEVETEDELPEQEEKQQPVFSEEFAFSGTDKPIEISLRKIPDETVPISEVKKEVQDAYNQGFSDGQDTTTATFKTQIRQHQKWLKNLDSVISELRGQFSETLVKLDESLIELATFVSEHILEREVTSNSDIVIEQTRKAIASLDSEIVFKIRLNPSNIEILENVKSQLITDASVRTKVELIADDSVGLGGCILETSAGTVDARLKTQLEKIAKSLEEEIQKQPG